MERVRARRIEQKFAAARNAKIGGDLPKARELCKEVLMLDADHAEALVLAQSLEVAAKVEPKGRDAYAEAHLSFEKAKAASDPEDAFAYVLQLRNLDPADPRTEEALRWVSTAWVASLRHRLERERSKETAEEFLDKIQRLLDVRPGLAVRSNCVKN